MGVLTILRGDPQTNYGSNVAAIEVATGQARTAVSFHVAIDPTLPDRLPQFDLAGDDFSLRNVDVLPHGWNRDGFVTDVFLRGVALHPVHSGNDGRDYEVQLVQRAADQPPAFTSAQYVEPTGLASLKLDVELPNQMGVATVTLQGQLKQNETGVWHKQTEWFSRFMSPDDGRPICGVTSWFNQYSAEDFVRVQVIPHNDLFNPDTGAGYFVENDGTGGPLYYHRLTLRDVPAGWEPVHWNCNASTQGGLDLVKAEPALQDWTNPAGGTHPVENSWHVMAARGANYFEFGLRRTATCSLAAAREIMDGAGIGRLIAGELDHTRRPHLQAMGWRSHDVPDSFTHGGLSGRAALRKQMQEHWANTLSKVQSGGQFGGFGSARFGTWHLAGEPVAHQGGAQELIPIVAQYRMREELNALKVELKGKLYRHAVGRYHHETGDLVAHDFMVEQNGGLAPFLQPANDHELSIWDPHFRAGENALNSSLGNIDPGVSRHVSGRPVSIASLMPQNRKHNYPGAGQHVVEPPWSFPFHVNDWINGPYPGTHHERISHVFEGGWDYSHDLVFKWLLAREAEHVMECYSRHPTDPRGEDPASAEYYRHEYNLHACLESFASNPATQARKYWGGRCEQEPGADGPRWIHRLWGQFGICTPAAGRVHPPGPERTRWRQHFQDYVRLANFRCTEHAFGMRTLGDASDLGYSAREYNWGIHDPVNRDGSFNLDFQFGAQMWFNKYPAKCVTAGERIFGIDPDLGGVADRDWSRLAFAAIRRQQAIADYYRQKVPSQYTLVGSVDEPGVATLDQKPDGNYGGTGNGVEQLPWRVRRSKASERASLPVPTDPNHQWQPSLKATLGSQAIEFWAQACAYGEVSPGDIPEGVALLDELRKVIEGLVEEWTGQRVWLTWQQAYEACFAYWSDSGVGVYWWTWDRPRCGTGAGYMQRAAQILERHPTWSVEGNDQGRLAEPAGVSVEDTPAGLVVRWTVDAAATTMFVDWGELQSHEGGPEHFEAGLANDGEHTIPAAELPDGFTVFVRLSGEDLQGRQGTSTGRMAIVVGSGATVQQPTVGGGGGGTGDEFPATPVLSEATPVAGGLDLEVTIPPGGQPTIVFGVEKSAAGEAFTQVLYQQVSELSGSGPTYTVPVRNLAAVATDVRVRARAGNANWSNYSDTLTRTPLPGSGGGGGGGLPGPENVTMTASGDRITVNWDPVQGAAVYFLGWGPTETPNNEWTWQWFGYNGPIAHFNPLPPVGEERFFAVAAHSGTALGQPSEVWRVVMPSTAAPAGGTGPTPPSAPTFSNPTQGDGEVSVSIS